MNTSSTTTRTAMKVWDPFVRLAHWLLVIAFATAWLTGDENQKIHTWAGYTIAGLVLLRVLWGFIGTHHARFSSFITGPKAVISYLRSLITGGGPRFIGHNPAGAAMVLALLLSLAATAGSGMALHAADDGRGPLAGLVPRSHAVEESFEEIHEFMANLTLALVFLHIGGVLLSGCRHRENLMRAMVTGKKSVTALDERRNGL